MQYRFSFLLISFSFVIVYLPLVYGQNIIPYSDETSRSQGNEVIDSVDTGEPGSATPREKRTFDDPDVKVKEETYWIDKKTNIIAIDPTVLGGTVTSVVKTDAASVKTVDNLPRSADRPVDYSGEFVGMVSEIVTSHELVEISIDNIGFKYENYDSFVLVPDDGIPSMVLVFSKGSVISHLHMDNDARALLDNSDSIIEIVGTTTMNIDKSDIKKTEGIELYTIEIRDKEGRKNLKMAMDSELKTGSKSIYPMISAGELRTKGTRVLIKTSREIGFFEIRSINDLLLWLNLKFGMNLDNKEKQILQEGIYSTLQKAVDDATATPSD